MSHEEQEERWIEIEHRECSEDRRHFTTLSWGFPPTILVTNAVLLSAARMLAWPLSSMVTFLGGAYAFILTIYFKKVVYYSEERLQILRGIADKYNLQRYGKDRIQRSPRWVKWRVGGNWMFMFLVAFTSAIFFIAIFDLVNGLITC